MGRRGHVYINLDENPVRALRKSLGMTIDKAAREANVHIQTWYLTERGACREIPIGILDFIVEREVSAYDGKRAFEYSQKFRDFQRKARRAFWEVQGPRILDDFQKRPLRESDPASFIERVLSVTKESSVGLSKYMCIAPTVITAILNGRRQKLPREVLEAFIEAGWPVEEIFNTGVRI